MIATIYVDTALNAKWDYASAADPAYQPWLVRLAWILDDGKSDPLQESCHLIKVPAAVRMDAGAIEATGIQDHTGPRVSLGGAMTEFLLALSLADMSVAYGARHHAAVLDHTVTYRLGHPRPPWPPMHCAMQAAVELAQRDEAIRDATNNMTAGSPKRRGNQYLKFADAAAARGINLNAAQNPISAGHQRVWAVRAIWLATEQI